MKDHTSQISVAKNAGIACVALLVIDLLVPFIAGPNKNVTIDIINLAFYAGVSVTYVLMLRGLLPIAAEGNDQKLLKDLNIFIVLTIVTSAVCAPLMMQSVISATFQGTILL